jgi:nicotinamide phosphoribosyltransferase
MSKGVLQMSIIEQLLSPKPTDISYTQNENLKISLICRVDSYKFSHPFAYPSGIKGMSSYGEARMSGGTFVVPFGMQLVIKRYLTERITMQDIDDAENFSVAHFGRKLFDRKSWEKVVNVYGGMLPLIIRSVPEGTILRGGLPIYTVTVLDQDLFWMSAGFETLIQRAIWYPTTIATMDYNIKKEIRSFYEKTGANLGLLPFSLHDFGGRGVSSGETAEIGGAAHLVNFMGSDTIEGILTANFYYKEPMSGFSVYATEHSIECSFGSVREDAKAYIRHQLANAPTGSILSIVIDGYDVYREAEIICTDLRDEIIASGVKVVFRPDSGDMMEVIPRILKLQEMAFGVNMTDKGYKQINNVGIIQGDGINHKAIVEVLTMITDMGYSADCVIFGSGGALLQKVDRDTLKFAQKASSILVDGEWKGISKNPITDTGKKSKEGVMTTLRSKITGELMAARLDQGPISEEFEDVMNLYYHTGKLFNETTLSEIRNRVGM